ncbi:hypothetical protein C8Q75DRAFT_789278 [Abortiporus biennis]|nr:hypothetical protein C8Q75DRAFT_789278 [Abortiporus biennis]
MIQTEGDDAIPDLRQTLSELNEKFTTAGIKFYYVQEPGQPGLSGSELVKASKNNILIETLKAGRIGLPIVAEPIYLVQHESGVSIQILHPSVLILTKLKRWFHSHSSTRPKTILKVKSDQRDIDYMIYWLAQEGMRIRFDLYEGKSRQELLIFVETYKKKFEENETLMATLRSILEPEDWNEICAEDSELEESVNLAQAVDDEQQARVALTVADVDVPHT